MTGLITIHRVQIIGIAVLFYKATGGKNVKKKNRTKQFSDKVIYEK